VDASLAEEWERMRDPAYAPLARASGVDDDVQRRAPTVERPYDITEDPRAFTAAIRTRVFSFLIAWSRSDAAAALDALGRYEQTGEGFEPWTAERLRAALDAYLAEHQSVRFDPEARNLRHTYLTRPEGGAVSRVQQVLVDPEMHNDWVAEFEVDLAASRGAQQPLLALVRIGPVGIAGALTP
jgi:hypothetical protein